LTHGFRPVSGPSLHSLRFSGNQYASSLLERRERFRNEKPTREYLSDEFGIDSFSAGILIMYFDRVVMLNISFIPTIVALLQESLLKIELLSGQWSTPLTDNSGEQKDC
jgi:hypothetical protein